MREVYRWFLKCAACYGIDGFPRRKEHLEWAAALLCKVLYLGGRDGSDKKDRNYYRHI